MKQYNNVKEIFKIWLSDQKNEKEHIYPQYNLPNLNDDIVEYSTDKFTW